MLCSLQANQIAEKALRDPEANESDVGCAPKLLEVILQVGRGCEASSLHFERQVLYVSGIKRALSVKITPYQSVTSSPQ